MKTITAISADIYQAFTCSFEFENNPQDSPYYQYHFRDEETDTHREITQREMQESQMFESPQLRI